MILRFSLVGIKPCFPNTMSFLWSWHSSVSATSLLCGRPEWAALGAGMGRPLANHPRSLCPLGDGKYRGKLSLRIDSGGLIFVKWNIQKGKNGEQMKERERKCPWAKDASIYFSLLIKILHNFERLLSIYVLLLQNTGSIPQVVLIQYILEPVLDSIVFCPRHLYYFSNW